MKRSDRGSQIAAIDLFNVAFAGRLDGQVVRAPADRRDDRSPGLALLAAPSIARNDRRSLHRHTVEEVSGRETVRWDC
jgi:hypothetical protein